MIDAPKMTREHLAAVVCQRDRCAMEAEQRRKIGKGPLSADMAEMLERRAARLAEVAAFLRSHTDD
jgi:hypothetical protein